MKKKLGNFIVMFKPGVVTGIYNENEMILRDICEKLGGFNCKLFDPYFAYDSLADAGLLIRVEQRNMYGYAAVSFFYPPEQNEKHIRKLAINSILNDIQTDPKLFANGYAVIADKNGGLMLKCYKSLHTAGYSPTKTKYQDKEIPL